MRLQAISLFCCLICQVQGKKVKKENRLQEKKMAGNVGMHENNKPDFLHYFDLVVMIRLTKIEIYLKEPLEVKG